jgi:hydrogenase maturation protease
MTTRILTIGYGNPLRGDDGFGWHAGVQLACERRRPGCTVLVRHQLTPELAADVAEAGLVVLIDASCGGEPAGEIVTRRIDASPAPAHTWSHHLRPSALLVLSRTLYDVDPPMFVITATGATFNYGEGLSPVLHRALPEVVRIIRRVWSAAEELVDSRPAGWFYW